MLKGIEEPVMKLMKTSLVFGFLVVVMEPAAAAETTTTMNVSATVVNNCSISATDLVFGDYTGVIDVDSSFTVSATCTDTSPAWLSDDGGLNPDGVSFRRQMIGPDGGAELLTYALYTDAGYTSEFYTTDVLGISTDLFPRTFYGRIPADIAVNLGGYTDTLTWTLTW